MDMLISEELRTEKGLLGDADGGVESARLNVEECYKVQIEVQMNSGSGTTCSLNLRQHDAASSGNSKDLVSTLPYYKKTAAENKFTRVDANVAAIADLDTAEGSVLVEVCLDDLDHANGFKFISLQVADPGAARIVSVSYHMDAKRRPAYEVEL